jgi:hypothetical protein
MSVHLHEFACFLFLSHRSFGGQRKMAAPLPNGNVVEQQRQTKFVSRRRRPSFARID